jgi:hypothetical protein
MDRHPWTVQLLVCCYTFSIGSPFSYPNSVNAHAEELRAQFVQHEGKRKLTVTAMGTRYTVDFGALAHEMTDQIHKNVCISPSKNSKVCLMSCF